MGIPALIIAGAKIGAAAIGTKVLSDLVTRFIPGGLTTNELIAQQQGTTLGRTFPVGADIKIESQGLPQGTRFEVDPVTGEITILKRRRRRKRLLTCSDKADIAFLTGTLGKGALAQGAITSVLSKCG